MPKGFEFYDIQKRAIEAVFNDYRAGYQNVLSSCPTGFGKTLLMGGIVAKLIDTNVNSLMLAHRSKLLEQSREKFRYVAQAFDIDPKKIDIVTKESNAHKYAVAIASIQSSYKWTTGLQNRGFLLVDEAHHSVSNTYRTLYKNFAEINSTWYGLGVTATAFRTNKKECLGDIFERISFHVDLATMIRDGLLTSLRCRQIELAEFDTQELHTIGGDFDKKELNRLINTPAHNKAVAEQTKLNAPDSKMIIFAVSISHCEGLAKEFEKVGIKCGIISYKQTKKEQDELYHQHTSGIIQALISVDLLTEGYDDETISCVVFVRHTQSPIVWIQGIGRGLRLFPGKKECLLLDFTDNSDRLSLSMPPNLLDEADLFDDEDENEDEFSDPHYFSDDKEDEHDNIFTKLPNGDLIIAPIAVNEIKLIDTEFAWSHHGTDWVLSLGIEEGSIIIHKLDSNEIACSVFKVAPNTPPIKLLGPVDRAFAMMTANNYAETLNTRFSQKNRDWRTLPATPGQINLLKNLNADKVSVRGLASDLIALKFFHIHLKKYSYT
jgi:superfamily II DNA or RNA helicase